MLYNESMKKLILSIIGVVGLTAVGTASISPTNIPNTIQMTNLSVTYNGDNQTKDLSGPFNLDSEWSYNGQFGKIYTNSSGISASITYQPTYGPASTPGDVIEMTFS